VNFVPENAPPRHDGNTFLDGEIKMKAVPFGG
jgi:hypothetical protein